MLNSFIPTSVYFTEMYLTEYSNVFFCGNVQCCAHRVGVNTGDSFLLTYLLTPWSRVLLEKLTGLQLVKKFPHFMEPEGSSPHSQAHTTYPYAELAPSSPHTHIPLPEDPS